MDLSELLPSRLGAPEVTLRDLISNRDKPKEPRKISTIQQWVVCFNAFISVMAVRHPERVHDLLGYASMITKSSLDYEGAPWLAYDAHFRRAAAASRQTGWAQVDASLWTLYFTCAKPSGGAGGLAIVESPTKDRSQEEQRDMPSGSWSTRQSAAPYNRPSPICKRWNFQFCTLRQCNFRHICITCHSPRHQGKWCPSAPKTTPNLEKPPDTPFRREGLRGGRQK